MFLKMLLTMPLHFMPPPIRHVAVWHPCLSKTSFHPHLCESVAIGVWILELWPNILFFRGHCDLRTPHTQPWLSGRTNLREAWGAGVGGVGGGEADRGVHGALPLLLVDPVSLALRQVEEVLHRFQVDQQRLRGRARVLLLPQDLRQQTLDREDMETHLHSELLSHSTLKKRSWFTDEQLKLCFLRLTGNTCSIFSSSMRLLIYILEVWVNIFYSLLIFTHYNKSPS